MHLLYVIIRTIALSCDVYVWYHAEGLNLIDEEVKDEVGLSWLLSFDSWNKNHKSYYKLFILSSLILFSHISHVKIAISFMKMNSQTIFCNYSLNLASGWLNSERINSIEPNRASSTMTQYLKITSIYLRVFITLIIILCFH